MQTFNILERLKTVFQVDSDVALAQILGVKQPTISSWRKRNTIDYELIFTKCNNINYDWLLTGEGKMKRVDNQNTDTPENYGADALLIEKDKMITYLQEQIKIKDGQIKELLTQRAAGGAKDTTSAMAG